ncbi:restriction endonuclease subunit S [Pseudoramibacter porci]|uniref:Restriction endonuclease subunit S n=1 Tax=Pseudoramibacter porci TaxID=2606631 RepID=A0A7X2NF39_9FIRM|nr:restriction endonuclease subunit S [Pseudoramibacter porci]MSS19266.1 restriction endonuclease subunit S [Pseudoramibacter porci]
MTQPKKAPEIRFKGFTDDWEQRKLGEVGSVSMCRRIFKEQTSESGDIPFYKIGTFGGQADAYISRELFAEYRSKYPYPKEGDILISASGSIGRTVEFTGKNEYFQDSNIVWLSHDDRLDNTFLKCFYSVVKWAGIEGSTINRLYNDNILNTVISMPSIAEQKNIGTFFKELNHLITLHQRKHKKLLNIKKSMLEKMFPKDGEVVPEIRFKGFTDAWEQRKVGELTNVLSASRVHKEEWAEDGIPFFRSSDVVSAFKGIENEKAFISIELYEKLAKSSGKLEQNDILITGGGSIGIPYIVPDNKPLYSKDADLIWIKHSANFDSTYLYTYFISEEFREYLASISHTGTIAHYTIEQVKDTPVRLPLIDEQRALGDFFVSLDHLITLHQRKLKKLETIKKAMLEKMFV